MKNIIVLFWIAFFCIDSIASEPNSSWIASKEGKYFCKEISVRGHRARIVTQNGEKMSFPVEMVSSYSLNGSEFHKLPLYKNGKITSHEVFMELICKSKDCILYRYGHCKIKSIEDKDGLHDYYIYKGKNLHIASNCIGLPEACLYNKNKQRYK